ncbi:MAG TPA: DNA polymerase III subunit delta' C-terminal domain-containing protein [Candidatus Polarisedimenticolia bacterium]|jgi:DNA polymerase-3 subunit delta'
MTTRFSEIAGHDRSLGVLRRCLADGRLHHSMIFHGPEAVGKRTVALSLAAALNCREGSGEACGACPSCRKVERQIHPDVRYLTLERTVIPIDAVRKLRDEAAYRPFEGRRRVFILDPADRMSTDAQNALLKTLEEPSRSSCLILITSRLMHLLPTTRSRCQLLAFGTMPPSVLTGHLVRLGHRGEAEAARASRLAAGRFGAALELDLEKLETDRDELIEILERLSMEGPRAHVLDDTGFFGTETEEIGEGLTLLAGLVRDMMVLAWGASGEALIHADRTGRLQELAARFSGRLESMLDRVRMASADLERNVNRKLLLETMMFDLAVPAVP